MSATQRYYGGLVGRWSGAVRADTTALRWLGAAMMSTSLEAAGADFIHTTRISKWGMVVFESEERMVLDADGRRFTVTGTQKSALMRRAPYTAEGEVSDDATRATYHLAWGRRTMEQTTHIVETGLELEQVMGRLRTRVRLHRLG